ncbi:YraN family protein [Solimonas soli]|uniref:YraN family protein n=1 Tax=Solimonas soli TaxID=413479 RepID=UPI0004820B71|nr:YraN family protein [Solimonas soli]
MNGAAAEDAALRLLERQGLKLVARNARFRGGELDLVMREGETLVIVEVRARGASRFASALESVDARKRGKVLLAAQLFLAAHPEHAERAVRFDVVAFDEGRPQWLKAAFDAG